VSTDNPVAWLGSTLTPLLVPPRMIEMTNDMTNPTNEKNMPRSITLTARMFYSWILTRRANAKTAYGVKIKGDDLWIAAVAKIWSKSKLSR